jgi:hypothetical protein
VAHGCILAGTLVVVRCKHPHKESV